MKSSVLVSILCIFSMSAFAQSPFDLLSDVEAEYKQERAAAKAEEVRKAEAAQAKQQALDEQYRRQKLAADQRAEKRALEISNAKAEEDKRIRSRDEQFEDEARALVLEEKKLEIAAKKARVARSDEYIDAELSKNASQTDVIQSEVD